MLERSSSPTDAIVARVEGVSKTYGDVRALDAVDVVFDARSLVAIVGANGSGKTTLLRLLAGVIAPDRGRVLVLGDDPRERSMRQRGRVGYAGQELALDPEMRGDETMRLFYALRGLRPDEREACLSGLVEMFELAPFIGRAIATYSGGQRQRLHLALESMHGPALLLLDEPTANLDPAGRRSLWSGLRAWCTEGGTCVMVTHDLGDVATHADRVILLERGRVVADGTPASIVAEHGRARTSITLADAPADPDELRSHLEREIGRGRVDIEGTVVHVIRPRAIDGPEPALAYLTGRGIAISRFEAHAPDLSDAFFALTGTSVASDKSRSPRVGGRRGPGSGGGRGRGGGDR